MENIVEIEKLTKDYEVGFWRKKKVRALEGLSLNVAPGQIFGFLGGNGAGKTTTIKILMGLLFPTSGTARILSSDISDVSMHKRIGYCPENPYFYDYLTASELMNYFGELFGLNQNERTRRSSELLAKVGLEEKDWNKQLRKFSKGMLQRVGLAQSLVNEPEIVFFDEPMSGLDPIGRREIRELIIDLRAKGTTVFMSTHILSDVEALCDEVAILRGGKLTAMGNLDELLATQGEQQIYEVSLNNIKSAQLPNAYTTFPTASGVIVHVSEEGDIEKVLSEARAVGGRLVSVQIVRQSLEELFVEAAETGAINS
ncbi:MAG: ABC transporter ATP-binding protein [Pyrinomonadaceae bacterium]